MREIVKTDCRHYLGDRPCRPHKEQGVHCQDCTSYDPVPRAPSPHHPPFPKGGQGGFKEGARGLGRSGRGQVLIIKLDAMGDVLRTTPVLYSLRHSRPHAQVTWITRPEAVPLLQNNELIDRVIPYGAEAVSLLSVERFDTVLNLDSSPDSSSLAAQALGKEKMGFGLDDRGAVVPLNGEAEDWYLMGLFDDVKKKNTKTYQQIIHEIARLPYRRHEPILRLTAAEEASARECARQHRLDNGKATIGFNTGAGTRWAYKKWRLEGYVELIEKIGRSWDVNMLLLGGPEEEERNQAILNGVRSFQGSDPIRDITDPGCHHPIREFAAIMSLCDVVVTGDTIALHLATALKKNVVALFGPTSATEIELYGRGRKVLPTTPCRCFYLPDCTVNPTCMDQISADMVFQAIEELLPP